MRRQKRHRTNARLIAQRPIEPGDASQVFQPFRVRQGEKFVLCVRVSNRERKANLKGAEKNLRWRVERRGGIVVDVVSHQGSGVDSSWIRQAALIARQHGATLLFESTDRAIRSTMFHSQDRPDRQPNQEQLEDVQFRSLGVPLQTHLNPAASPTPHVRHTFKICPIIHRSKTRNSTPILSTITHAFLSTISHTFTHQFARHATRDCDSSAFDAY
jgi:hypothetical protein